MPPKIENPKHSPQARNTEIRNISFTPTDLATIEWFRDRQAFGQKTNAGALRLILAEWIDFRHKAGLPTPPWFEDAIAELS